MRILALDQKVSGTGWCLADGDTYIDSGYYNAKGNDAWDKINDIGEWLQGVLFDSGADVVVLEYPSGNKGNMDTSLKLGAALYECILTARTLCRVIVIVRPTEVKKTEYSKDLTKHIEEWNGIATPWKFFVAPRKKDGAINKAEVERIGDELDAIGAWLAGKEKLND